MKRFLKWLVRFFLKHPDVLEYIIISASKKSQKVKDEEDLSSEK